MLFVIWWKLVPTKIKHGTMAQRHCPSQHMQQGHLDVVRHLVEVGAHKDQATNYGETPLCVSAEKGHLDVVRHLVEVGAHQNEATRDTAETALHAAAESGHVEIVRF